jgi:hypothetical protein
VGAKIPATTASRWGKAHLLGSLLHKPVMSNLISVALIVAREAPDFGLMLNALLRRHQLPAARISLVGAPGPEGVSRANHAEKQKESSKGWHAVRHITIPLSARVETPPCAACGALETSFRHRCSKFVPLRFKLMLCDWLSFLPRIFRFPPSGGKPRF